jgi:trimethylamine--corrinoid protein Co-methyltransferase
VNEAEIQHQPKRTDFRRDRPQPKLGLVGGQYAPLVHGQIRQIHEAAITILAQTGLHVPEPTALEKFRMAGARISGARVYLHRALVEDAIAWAPSEVVLSGRDPKWDLNLAGTRVHVGTGGAATTVFDLEDGQSRPAVLADVADLARLVDALEHIHFFLVPIYPTDLSAEEADINVFYAGLAHTTKHVQAGVYTVQGIRDVVEMCERVMGGADALRRRPIVSFITSWMISPLQFDPGVTRLLMEVCSQQMPVVLSASPMAGTTAPVTLAGLLAQLTAEQLAGLVLTQLVNRGTPVLLGPIPAVTDMRTGRYLSGVAEFGLANAAMAQIAQFYGLPIYNSAGMTDASTPDIQAGFEKAMSVVLVALAGSNFIHHAAGMLDGMNAVAPRQFVIDNDILGMALRVLQGIQVDDERLALDVIEEVGPGGNFLMTDHTLRHMRTEFHYPSAVVDRRGRQKWSLLGTPDVWERARAIAWNILTTHNPEPLDRSTDDWIRQRFRLLI